MAATDTAKEKISGKEGAFISVIIPVHNDVANLHRCLVSLKAQTYLADRFEVIVVDNNSDEPLEAIATEFPDVSFTSETTPGSYAARNKGISLAKGEYLAFTDSDCIVDEDWLKRGAASLEKNPECGLVGGEVKVTFANPEKPTAVELYEQLFAFPQRTYIEKDHFSVTANLFTSRAVFDAVGLFNDSLESGGDREWGNRVSDAGYPLIYDERVCIRHPARRTFNELRRKATRVMGGVYEIDSAGVEDTSKAKILRLLGFLVPPFKSIVRAFRDKRLGTLGRKLKVAAVLIAVRYVNAFQYARYMLRGTRKR